MHARDERSNCRISLPQQHDAVEAPALLRFESLQLRFASLPPGQLMPQARSCVRRWEHKEKAVEIKRFCGGNTRKRQWKVKRFCAPG